MLCRHRRQQAGHWFVDTRAKSVSGNKHRKITPSLNLLLALAVLLIDWSTSYGHSRVFNPCNNLENADTPGALIGRSAVALSQTNQCRPTLSKSACFGWMRFSDHTRRVNS
jgi:hypothetical protein